MGGKSCKASNGGKRTITIVVLGLDNAGKTTTKLALEKQPNEDVIPTVGYSDSDIVHRNERIKLIDLGGAKNFRDAWRHYYADSYGFVYVLDSSEEERLKENQDVFRQLLQEEKVKGKPILILANKQDKPDAIDRNQILIDLNIERSVNESKSLCRVELCSARSLSKDPKKAKVDDAIRNGFDWLIRVISESYDILHRRVEEDIRLRDETEKRERAERKARVEKLRQEREKEEGKKDDDGDAPHIRAGFVPIGQAVKNAERGVREKSDKVSDQLPPIPAPRSSTKTNPRVYEATKSDETSEVNESPRRLQSRVSRFDDDDSNHETDELEAIIPSNTNKKKKLVGPGRPRSGGDSLPPPAPSTSASRRDDFPLTKGPTVGTPRPSATPVAQWAITTQVPQTPKDKLLTIASDNELDADDVQQKTNRSTARSNSTRKNKDENDSNLPRIRSSSSLAGKSKSSNSTEDNDEENNYLNRKTSEDKHHQKNSSSRNTTNGSKNHSARSRENYDNDDDQ